MVMVMAAKAAILPGRGEVKTPLFLQGGGVEVCALTGAAL
jgi:hypothetical protein